MDTAGRGPDQAGFRFHSRPRRQLRIRRANHPGFLGCGVIPEGGIGGVGPGRSLVKGAARRPANDVQMIFAAGTYRAQRRHFQLQRARAGRQPQLGLGQGIGRLRQSIVVDADAAPMLGDRGGQHCADDFVPHPQGGAAIRPVLNLPDIIAGQDTLGYNAGLVKGLGNAVQGDEMRPLRRRFVGPAFAGDNQAVGHSGIGGKGHFRAVGEGANHGNILIAGGQHFPELGPIHAGDGGKRQHQGQDAAGFQLFVGQGGEPGTQAHIAVIASAGFHGPHPFRHRLLVGGAGSEGRKGGGDFAGRFPFPGGVAGKGRVHNHQVKPPVRHFGSNLADGFIAIAAHLLGGGGFVRPIGIAHIEQGWHRRGLQQFQGADFDFPILLPAERHSVEAGFGELDGRLDAGQGGTGDMHGPRHYIAAVKDFLHHYRMKGRRIAAGPFVAGGDLVINRRQQGAGAAGQIGDAQLAQGLTAAPVHSFQFSHGQAG